MGKRVIQLLIALAKRLGQMQAWLILTCFYFVILTPVALLFKRRADPLRLRRGTQTAWRPRSQPLDSWEWAKSQS